MSMYLDFEKPVIELESKIEELRHLSNNGDMNIADEVTKMQAKVEKQLEKAYSKLTAWQKVQVARHSERPQYFDYIEELLTDFVPMAGDRLFSEDNALIGGFARLDGEPVMVIGHQKGNDTESRLRHNFGMARPEGYRKAQRLMKTAERFGIPVVTFVDTNGAFPGKDAEERGQSEAIAKSIEVCLGLKVPLITIIIGEGGSGGAIAIAAANTVIMLEHSVYSVISPEGCASILWRSATKASDAANALRLTAQDLHRLGIIDRIIKEPLGGAHRHRKTVMHEVGKVISKELEELSGFDGDKLKKLRREKFLRMGREGI